MPSESSFPTTPGRAPASREVFTQTPVPRWRRVATRVLLGLAALSGVLLLMTGIRWLARPAVPGATAAQIAQAERVQITRDEWGVPHIHGQSNADAAFGLAFAHAEDDYPLIQGALVAARGELSRMILGETALVNDFYVRLFRIADTVDAEYDKLSPDVRAVLDGYAAGFNYYAALHPDEADSRFLPVTGRNIAAGFAHKLPLFQAVNRPLKVILTNDKLKTGDPVQMRFADADSAESQTADSQLLDFRMIASNAHAVGRRRSADGVVRLNVNSHQPWEGAVAWYEAHLQSDEGWNMIGGTFPGAPMIFHGHNAQLGWAHTVNAPDMWDVFELEMHPDEALQYRFGDEWRTLDVQESAIAIDLGPFVWNESREFYWSVYGPALQTDSGKFFALRHTALQDTVLAVEQWYRMNLASSFAEWQEAMRMQAIPMFHTVYADAQNIHYVYNAKIPKRNPDYDWSRVVPGNTPDTLWTEFLTYDELPEVTNPPADYIQNCNSNPFFTTAGAGNPRPEKYTAVRAGIETRMTNRAIRSHELFGEDNAITREDFLRYKWDRRYSQSGSIYSDAINPIFAAFGFDPASVTSTNSELADTERVNFHAQDLALPTNRFEREGLAMLARWNGSTNESNTTAALAILSFQPIFKAIVLDRALERPDPVQAYRDAVRYLLTNYGRVAVPLGTVQRLRRGDLDLPLGGGPDILNATHSKDDGGQLIGWAGDSYIQVVEFHPDGPRSMALHQYGNVNRADSPNYSDQARLFQRRTLRRTLFDPAELAERTVRIYRPGQSD